MVNTVTHINIEIVIVNIQEEARDENCWDNAEDTDHHKDSQDLVGVVDCPKKTDVDDH